MLYTCKTESAPLNSQIVMIYSNVKAKAIVCSLIENLANGHQVKYIKSSNINRHSKV